MTIALCGNHKVIYCTESELAWTLEQMGHTVLRLQENTVSTNDMLTLCRQHHVSLFLYVHTHGWKTPGTFPMEELIGALRAEEIPTASFHLDLYWGLGQHHREAWVGQHPFWQTDRVFTADGGHQSKFEARGVRHQWLPPAVAARHCYRGNICPEYDFDVIFVGSRKYHAEYPFRERLIQWLERTYHRRFRRFGGDCGGVVREGRLNDLYASAKVVVGDSCFAGSPFYWSDRVPETLGRGGFLIHPATEGLNIEGLATFPARDLETLKGLIDHHIQNPEARHVCTERAMTDVRLHHTYTQRMEVVLAVMRHVYARH